MKSLNFIQIFCFVFALVLYSNTELNAQCPSTDPSTGGIVPTQSTFPGGPPSCGDDASHRFDPVMMKHIPMDLVITSPFLSRIQIVGLCFHG